MSRFSNDEYNKFKRKFLTNLELYQKIMTITQTNLEIRYNFKNIEVYKNYKRWI